MLKLHFYLFYIQSTQQHLFTFPHIMKRKLFLARTRTISLFWLLFFFFYFFFWLCWFCWKRKEKGIKHLFIYKKVIFFLQHYSLSNTDSHNHPILLKGICNQSKEHLFVTWFHEQKLPKIFYDDFDHISGQACFAVLQLLVELVLVEVEPRTLRFRVDVITHYTTAPHLIDYMSLECP